MASDITFKIGGDASGFNAELGKIANAVRASTTNVLQLGATLNQVFETAKKMTGVVSAAFQEAGAIEDAATRLAPLVGGLEEATSLCKKLRRDAANGTMQFEQLTNIAGRLSTVFSNTADVEKWTTVFHDLAAATGMDVNELLCNFVKLKAAGKVTGELPEMFAQKGINIFEPLMAATGKTQAELRKMATEGTLAFSQIEDAILSLTTNGGKFEGMAQKMSSTATGSFETMTDTALIALGELGESVNESLKSVFVSLTASLNELMPAFHALGSAVGGIVSVFSTFTEIAGGGSMAVGLLAMTITGAVPQLKAFILTGNDIAGVRKNIASLSSSLRGLSLNEIISQWKIFSRTIAAANAHVRAAHGGWIGFVSALHRGSASAAATANIFRTTFPRAFAVAGAAAKAFGVAFRAAMVVAKAAIASTGIGLVVVAIGEALGWAYTKLMDWVNAEDNAAKAAADLENELEDLRTAYKDIDDERTLRLRIEADTRELGKLRRELAAMDEDDDGYEPLKIKIDQTEVALARAQAAAFSRIRRQQAAEAAALARAESHAAEQRAASILNALALYEAEARAAQADGEAKRTAALMSHGLSPYEWNAEKVERQLNSLACKSELTAAEAKEAERLLAARKQLDAIAEKEAQAKAGLEQRVSLLKAELESVEKLRAVKEEIYKQELGKQYIEAGYNPEEALKKAQEHLALEKQVEQVRKQRQGDATVSAEEKDLKLREAELAGNTALLNNLKIEKEIARLKEQGVEAAKAEEIARRKIAIEAKNTAGVSKAATATYNPREAAWYGRQFGYDAETARKTAEAMAKWRQSIQQPVSVDYPSARPAASQLIAQALGSQSSSSGSGASPLVAVANSQLNVLTQMKNLLASVVQNTAAAPAAVLA